MSDPEMLFQSLLEQQANQKLPPVHLWNPEHVGAIDIRIDEAGDWYHDGRKIERQPLVDLFATILRKEEGNHYLVTPVEKLAIEVADVAFVAVDLDVRGEGKGTDLMFRTNVGDLVLADGEHSITMRGERPYLEVRGGLEAVIGRSVFYRLVDVGLASDGILYVYSAGERFALGPTE